MAKSRGLGRGLDSLIAPPPKREPPPANPAVAQVSSFELPVGKISPSRWQPRRDFDTESLEELAHSIEAHDLINPLVVRKTKDDAYELIAGERRLRAIRDILKWEKVQVRLMTAEDAKMRELALVENLQRKDLNPIEVAAAYHELLKESDLTHEALADRLKTKRPTITNAIRLLELPEEVKSLIEEGKLHPTIARSIVSLPNPVAQIKLARRIIEEDLSARQVERLMSKKRSKPASEKKRSLHIEDLEDRLRRHFGTKATIEDNKGRGRIILEYYSVAEAQRILDRMGLTPE
ncbi:MAG: ParB/RepB/Spo0J family partition protein [Planctomycetes bacterium]|nr:ParB/RepB/Spo0J family partition protein [Planctomycetota bacterium]